MLLDKKNFVLKIGEEAQGVSRNKYVLYVNSMDFILTKYDCSLSFLIDYVAKHKNIIEKAMSEKSLKQFQFVDNSRSEIWSDLVISKGSYVGTVNKILKKASSLMERKKALTSRSFKKNLESKIYQECNASEIDLAFKYLIVKRDVKEINPKNLESLLEKILYKVHS